MGAMGIGLAIKFTGTIFDLLIPYILEYIIDDVAKTKNIRLICIWGGAMILCSIFAVLGNVIANRMASRVASRTTQHLRHDLFVKTLYLSCAETDKFTIPSLESRLTSDTYNVHQFTGMMQRMGVRAPILLVGGLILTSLMDPVLTLVLLATLPFLAVSVFFISKKSIPLYTKLQNATDDMVRTVRENIQGIRVIKALSKTDYEKRRFDDVNRNLMRKEQTAGIIVSTTNPIMNFFLYLGLTVVIVVGAYRVNAGLSESGKILAFISYFTYILNAMLSVTRIFVTYSKFAASMKRISEVLDSETSLPQLIPEENDGEELTDEDVPFIEFDNVTFSYNGKRNNLKNISFRLNRCQSLGIIGATGSGKTTIIALLMRFYDPQSGVIRVNGRDIRTIDPDMLHSMFGVALQNDFLFADSISENVRFGRDVSDEYLKEAFAASQAEAFIREKDGGEDFMLDIKGANLSGGQKQRLLIARALVAHPEILILDDSSSALDYRTDANLRTAVRDGYASSTKIIVAQRVSSIMSSDIIMVMDSGEAIAVGTHDELMKNCNIYSEISSSQMGGAILD